MLPQNFFRSCTQDTEQEFRCKNAATNTIYIISNNRLHKISSATRLTLRNIHVTPTRKIHFIKAAQNSRTTSVKPTKPSVRSSSSQSDELESTSDHSGPSPVQIDSAGATHSLSSGLSPPGRTTGAPPLQHPKDGKPPLENRLGRNHFRPGAA